MLSEFDRKIIQYSSSIKDLGLMEGKMGACLFFYIIGKAQKKSHFNKQGELLLDNIINEVSSNIPTNFGRGLAGIGWGVEYLIQNKYVDGNSDEILEDIDNQILLTLSTINNFGLDISDGLSGYILYLVQRLKNKRTGKRSLSFDLNKELLIYTLNRIHKKEIKENFSFSDVIQFDFFQGHTYLLRLLRHVYDLHLFNDKVEHMASDLLSQLEAFRPRHHTNRLHLAIEIGLLSNSISTSKWNNMIDNLLHSVDFDSLVDEVVIQSISLRNGLTGLRYLLISMVNYLPTDSQYREKARQALIALPQNDLTLPLKDDPLLIQKISLSKGIMGARLLELFVNSPNNGATTINPLLI